MTTNYCSELSYVESDPFHITYYSWSMVSCATVLIAYNWWCMIAYAFPIFSSHYGVPLIPLFNHSAQWSNSIVFPPIDSHIKIKSSPSKCQIQTWIKFQFKMALSCIYFCRVLSSFQSIFRLIYASSLQFLISWFPAYIHLVNRNKNSKQLVASRKAMVE